MSHVAYLMTKSHGRMKKVVISSLIGCNHKLPLISEFGTRHQSFTHQYPETVQNIAF